MPVPFTQIPAALLVPGQYQEIDSSLAGSSGEIKRALIIAGRSAAGTAPAGVPVRVLSEQRAAVLFGHGSPAAIMARAFLEINRVEECWVLPVDAPQAATSWRRKFSVEAASAKQGAVAVTVNGARIDAAPVAAGASAEAVAASTVAAINGDLWLPVEAEVLDGGAFEVRAVVPGAGGNTTVLSIESEAEGVTVTAGAVTPGAQVANIRPLLQGLGSVRYNYVASDFTDRDNVAALAAELDDRFSAMRQIGGRAFVSVYGDVKAVLAAAAGVNNPHGVMVPRLENPQMPGEWAARWCAAAGRILADDPAANTHGLAVAGLSSASEPDPDTRQKLLSAGVATYRSDAAGNVLVERLVTSYTENPDGGRDTSFLDVQVPETVDAIRTHINAEARRRFGRWKLASTDENFGSGAKVMTAGIFRSFLCELYQEVFVKERRWAQDFEGYKNSITVGIKPGSKTRLEYGHAPVLMGQFYIGAGLLQFR